ncbi:MAG TPA: hypothetical protein VGM82_13870 [Gemmatimonadaceae bacterium]|jgi:hypothetical protein
MARRSSLRRHCTLISACGGSEKSSPTLPAEPLDVAINNRIDLAVRLTLDGVDIGVLNGNVSQVFTCRLASTR